MHLEDFPNFTKLKPEHRSAYEKLIDRYPPLSDICFPTLMIWWNLSDELAISSLNNNLIINYQYPNDATNSGLGLIGSTDVLATIEKIFAHQKDLKQNRSLVHVPEFTVEAIADKTLLSISEEIDYNEYLIDVDSIYPMDRTSHNFRRKIKKFINEAGEERIRLSPIDITDKDNQAALMANIKRWQQELKPKNDREYVEQEAIHISIYSSAQLGMRCFGVFVDNVLQGVAIYQITPRGDYLILNHVKVRYEYPRIFDFITYQVAKIANLQGIKIINLEMDLGIPGLRNHKLELHPSDFFRKYRIEPA